jgi:hypothetical protein
MFVFKSIRFLISCLLLDLSSLLRICQMAAAQNAKADKLVAESMSACLQRSHSRAVHQDELRK